MTKIVDFEVVEAAVKEEAHVEQASNRKDPLKSFISGGVGGMCLVAVGHPFDLIKVRMQTSTQYSSLTIAFKSIYRQDGLVGFYRGMATPFIGVTPIYAVCFWGYDLGQRLAQHYYSRKDERYPLPNNEKYLDVFGNRLKAAMFAGAFSALPTTLLMTPSERIKVILQIQGSNAATPSQKVYTGPIDVARSLGIRNLYKGTVATLVRDIPGNVAYFAAYDAIKHWMTQYVYKDAPKNQLPVAAILTAGGLAGWANWLVAIPADVIKSRIQAASDNSSGLTIFKNLLKNEGFSALFRGLGPALVRAFPANAACFLGVELTVQALNTLW